MSLPHCPDVVTLSVSSDCGGEDADNNLYNNYSDIYVEESNERVLGAHFDKPWVEGVAQAEEPVPAKKHPVTPWPHELEGVQIPMPDPGTLHVMRTEFYQ